MSNCQGCGSVLDPTHEEVNQAVDDVLIASLKDAKKHGEICPLCGHSQAQPISHRKSVQFFLLLALILLVGALAIVYHLHGSTEREAAASEALARINSNKDVTRLLGGRVSIRGSVLGQVKQDETGWREAHISLQVHGPKGDGTAQVSGGSSSHEPWKFTTLEVTMPQLKKKINLITGAIIEYDPSAYVDVHTEAAAIPEYVLADVPPARWDGNYPCVFAVANYAPQIGNCLTPVPMSRVSREPVDHFETDLRTGKFILRQTDLAIDEAGFEIPFTRTYTPQDWLHPNKNHAFGMDSNHPYDVAPVGTRNPYTEQFLVLEDGNFLYFPRVSDGTGYSDGIFRQSEAGNSFYKATQRWIGAGWEMQLQDGSRIRFPESYNARNMAQGAPNEMVDSGGNKIELIRDVQRNLQSIRGPDGASIQLAYDNQARIVRATGPDGKSVHYTYDASGHLIDVVHSDGTARYYFYENGLLTWIRDQDKNLLLHNSYSKGTNWLSQQEFSQGRTVRYRYELSKNGKYARRVFVTLPDRTAKTILTGYSISEVYQRMK